MRLLLKASLRPFRMAGMRLSTTCAGFSKVKLAVEGAGPLMGKALEWLRKLPGRWPVKLPALRPVHVFGF